MPVAFGYLMNTHFKASFTFYSVDKTNKFP